jgi:putative flippase GtrA
MIKNFSSFYKYTFFVIPLFFIDLALLFLLIDYFDIDKMLATPLSFFTVGFFGYFLERKYIFKRKNRTYLKGFYYYLFIILSGAVIVTFGIYILTDIFNIYYIISRVLVAIFSGFWDYFMNFYFNFKMQEAD